MSTEVAVTKKRSITEAMAERYGMDGDKFALTLKNTVMPGGASDSEVAAFLMVAREYDLNPFTKEIYAFKGKGGGIVPIVGVDGWAKLVNRHPRFNGVNFDDHYDDKGNLVSVTANFWRKDREKPIVVKEYLSECKRNTEPWREMPHRMLRNRAYIQGARLAFGFSGIYDDTIEAEHRVVSTTMGPRKGDVVEINIPEKASEEEIVEAAPVDVEPAKHEDVPLTDEQKKYLGKALERDPSLEKAIAAFRKDHGLRKNGVLTMAQAALIIEEIESGEIFGRVETAVADSEVPF